MGDRVRGVVVALAVAGVCGLVFGELSFALSMLACAWLLRSRAATIPLRTTAGVEARREIEGFRVFVTSANKADLISIDAWSVAAFERTLPYAVAVGEADG